MKIDFRKIKVTAIDRTTKEFDLSQELANDIYNNTQDVGELEISRDLFTEGEIEVDAAKAVVLNKYIRKDFKAFIAEAVCPILDNIINKNQTSC
ncbi:MAG: hypothetical protein GY755_13400 [Chloroflexi bacterium]|nr:hypothetical protein [Chloroflexota bacterium]